MAAKSLVPADEGEFIDMEFTYFSNFFLSPPNPNSSSEFEFQMSSSSSSSIFQHSEASSVTSPADELFYKGKLLPLHLPPRLQMLQHILQNEQNHSLPPTTSGSLNDSISYNRSQRDNQVDLMTSYSSTPITVTPFEPCNVTSYESSRVTDHETLNPEEEEEMHDSVEGAEKNQKKTMKKKKKKQQKKQHFSLTSRLRAWFGKVSCKFELAYATKKVADEGSTSKAKESNNLNHHKQINGKVVVGKKLYPFGQIIQRSDRNRFGSLSSRIEFRCIDIDTDYSDDGRAKSNRSIMRSSSLVGNKKLCFNGSASFSGLPNKSFYGSCQELEIGNFIMGAIAHCKQSHHPQYFN